MKLIKTLDEIQNHVPVQMTTDIGVVRPFIGTAERSHLVRAIGRGAFEALVNVYDSGPIADPMIKEAVELAQGTVCNLGYYLALPVLSVKIGNSGIQVFSNQDTKQAFNWQVDKVEKSLRELGFNNLEALLSLMAGNVAKFPEYIASDQYKLSQSSLIREASDFSRYFNIKSSRYVFSCLAYIMARVETQSVEPLFSEAFIASLKANAPTGKMKILVEKYLKPGIALLTGAKAYRERVITMENGVASINLIENYSTAQRQLTPAASVIDAAVQQLTDDGNRFLADGLAYAVANISDMPGFELPEVRKRWNVQNDRTKGIYVA